jgi:hypothetical protein
MTLYKIKLVSITLILFIAGCKEKDELTLPVKVNLTIGISTSDLMPDYLYFEEGKIGIRRIQFEGKREAGGDVFFETDPKMNFPKFPFWSFKHSQPISDFDIPQGIYYYMKWDIDLKKIVIDEFTEINDITDSLSIGLILSGYYIRDEVSWIPLIIAIDDTEQFSVRSCTPDGSSTIVLSGNKDYEANLALYLDYAFSSISRESLEEAISNVNGEQLIVISRNKNEDLYANLLYRIFISARIMVY